MLEKINSSENSIKISVEDDCKLQNTEHTQASIIQDCEMEFTEIMKNKTKDQKYYWKHRESIIKKNNEQYYIMINRLKNMNSNIDLSNKIRTVRKFKNKYHIMHLKATCKFLQNKESYIQQVYISVKLDYASQTNARLEADRMVTTCIYLRDHFISSLKQIVPKKIEMALSRLGGMSIDSNENCALTALCGNPKHTSSSDSYYKTSYNLEKLVSKNLVFIVNEK